MAENGPVLKEDLNRVEDKILTAFGEYQKSASDSLDRTETRILNALRDDRVAAAARMKELEDKHEALRVDMEKRDGETDLKSQARYHEMQARVSKVEDRAYKTEQEQNRQRNAKWQAIGIAVLASVLGMAGNLLLTLRGPQ